MKVVISLSTCASKLAAIGKSAFSISSIASPASRRRRSSRRRGRRGPPCPAGSWAEPTVKRSFTLSCGSFERWTRSFVSATGPLPAAAGAATGPRRRPPRPRPPPAQRRDRGQGRDRRRQRLLRERRQDEAVVDEVLPRRGQEVVRRQARRTSGRARSACRTSGGSGRSARGCRRSTRCCRASAGTRSGRSTSRRRRAAAEGGAAARRANAFRISSRTYGTSSAFFTRATTREQLRVGVVGHARRRAGRPSARRSTSFL